MQSENLLDPELAGVKDPPSKPNSLKKNLVIGVHAITFLSGFSLLVYLIYWYWDQVKVSVTNVGYGFILIVILNLSRHFLRAASMYRAIHPEQRNFKYLSAVAARFGGEAVTFFTFTGPFLGDATKAVLLKRNVPLAQGASAVIIDNLLYYASVIMVVLAGIASLLYLYGSNSRTMSNVLTGIVVFAILMFAALVAIVRFGVKPISWVLKQLDKRNRLPKFILRREHHLMEVEANVFDFYNTRRSDFFTIFGISMSVHLVSVCEVYLALQFLQGQAFVSTAFIIESLTKVINAVFSFIPGTIGVYEGGNGVILRILGYTAAVGVALALVRRGAILFSTFVGLIVLLWRTAARGAKHLGKPTR
jgi:uncharacterized protein (TIRG00374 family)